MVTINVCVGSACHLKGSYKIIEKFEKLIKDYNVEDKVELKGSFCLGHCVEAVSTEIYGEIFSINEDNIEMFFKEKVLGGRK
ncbi:(2Fe-2S) ferredoxin domain-containing protein [Clostridium rectalis]|uniref:(2Fe-2S) ferredoxin domain-containing protein n=1 Tax=Clostridium rectalis TaxID=2040295 RepID=UPI000F62D79B|nr:NAD(P)H-dependent oxidoreductase subunit E [Clostridium rectalis]